MSQPSHAGAVVCRHGTEGPEFLLVRASRAPFEWVLPKGHIEAGETPEDAAVREVLEESGVEAAIVDLIGDLAFDVRDKHVRVRYFLMRWLRMGTASENREIRWCSPKEAEGLLPFENARDTVRRAATLVG